MIEKDKIILCKPYVSYENLNLNLIKTKSIYS